jgi:hypothetical protein
MLDLVPIALSYWAAYQIVTVRAIPRDRRLVQVALLGTIGAVGVLLILSFIDFSV